MSIRNLISLLENVMPSAADIEDEISPADPAPNKNFNPPQLIDRAGKIRSDHYGSADTMAIDGWVSLTYLNDGWRVLVKLDGHKVTRMALEKAIALIEASGAGDLRIEDHTSRIPQNFSGWTRAGGLALLKTLLRKIKTIRGFGSDPLPGKPSFSGKSGTSGIGGSFNLGEGNLREHYLSHLMEMSDDLGGEDETETETPKAKNAATPPKPSSTLKKTVSRIFSNKIPEEDLIASLTRAQVARQAAKMSHQPAQKSMVKGLGDGYFYDKEEHTLVCRVFRALRGIHKTGRQNEAIMDDFARLARAAGYHGPRVILAPDGINAHLKEDEVSENLLGGWRAAFLREFDRQPKTEAGFNRAVAAARLTSAQAAEMKAEVMTPISESVNSEECRVGKVTVVGRYVYDVNVICGDQAATIRVKAIDAKEASTKVMTQDRLDTARWNARQTETPVTEVFGMFGDGNSGTWVRHRGGPCPVDPSSFVHYKLRNGKKGANNAASLNWSHDNTNPGHDIVKYCQ